MIYYLFSLALLYENNIYWNKKKSTKETDCIVCSCLGHQYRRILLSYQVKSFLSPTPTETSVTNCERRRQGHKVRAKVATDNTHTHSLKHHRHSVIQPHPAATSWHFIWGIPPPSAVAFFLSLSQLATLHVNFCRLRPCIDKKIHKILGIRAQKKRNGSEVRRSSRRRSSRSWEIQSDSSWVCQQPWKWHLSSANFGNLLI